MSVIRSEEESRYSVYGYFPRNLDADPHRVQPYHFPVIILRPAPAPHEDPGPDVAAAEGEIVPRPPEPEPTPVQNAERTAELILREAKKQADKILSQAWKEAETIQGNAREKGFELGHDEGVKAGREEGFNKMKTEAQPLFNTLQGAIQKSAKLETEVRSMAEQQLVRLALGIAEKIIKREVEAASPVVENLREAVKRAVDLNRLDIRVHPEDLELVQRYRPSLLAEVEGIKAVHIQADSALMPGGCIVETNFGDIDARIERQLTEIEKEIQEVAKPQVP